MPVWLDRADALTHLLRGGTASVEEWRNGVEDLMSRTSMQELFASIDFARLRDNMTLPSRGVATVRLDIDGTARELSIVPKLFGLEKGRAIIPHGHTNMVSAHLVLDGRFRLRQYDQLARDARTLLVRKSGDREIGVGAVSSIGEVRDNVHWFVATERSYTLDIIVTGLQDDAAERYDIFNLDMDAARREDDDVLRVPRLPVGLALKKYG